jgi:Cu-processing system ATP-binding protein
MIDIAGIEKRFGRQEVLQGLNLHVERGLVTAVVGPNGSGKTTLIKLILGLARPDRGHIIVDGATLDGGSAYRARLGYMPQAARFPENLTAREVVAMLRDLRGNPARVDDELLEAFRLAPELDKPLRTLSGGTRQKVSAVVAFLFDPAVLILDEPTAGLDPVASSILKDKILRERARGKTFILTSHIMSEVEELSDRIAFLLDGEVRFGGYVAELKQRTGQSRLERAIAQMMNRDQIVGVAA